MARVVNITENVLKEYRKEYELETECTLIGRDPSAHIHVPKTDLPLSYSFVSRIHAIIFDHNGYYLGDCSSYGTCYPIGRKDSPASSGERLENMLESEVFAEHRFRFEQDLKPLYQGRYTFPHTGVDKEKKRAVLFRMLQSPEIRKQFIERGVVKPLRHQTIFRIYPFYKFEFLE